MQNLLTIGITTALTISAQAVSITVTNGDFESSAANFNSNTVANPITLGWSSSAELAPGNYGETMPGLVGRQAGMHARGGNWLQNELTTSAQGAMDATTFGDFTVSFDYGYRRDTITAGDMDLQVSLWNLTSNTLLDSSVIAILDPGVGTNSLTATSVALSYDNGAQTGGDQIAVRFTNLTDIFFDQWQATAMFDNVTAEATVVPEPSSAALVGLGGLALLMRRRK